MCERFSGRGRGLSSLLRACGARDALRLPLAAAFFAYLERDEEGFLPGSNTAGSLSKRDGAEPQTNTSRAPKARNLEVTALVGKGDEVVRSGASKREQSKHSSFLRNDCRPLQLSDVAGFYRNNFGAGGGT